MPFSIVLSTQPAAFSALAYKGRLKENLDSIKKFGYDGVELAVRDPRLMDLDELHRTLKEIDLPVPAVGTGQAYGEDGLSLTHPNPEIRRQATERIRSHVDFAVSFNAVVVIGLIRGRKETEVTQDRAESWLLEALRECARANPSARLALEPINRYETNLLNSVDAALRFLDRLAADNVGILLDTFHMNIEEPSILGSIESAKDRLFHVHVADSNRWYPGAGHIDFAAIISTLDRVGYRGFLSAEILPCPDSDTAAERAIRHLHRFVALGQDHA